MALLLAHLVLFSFYFFMCFGALVSPFNYIMGRYPPFFGKNEDKTKKTLRRVSEKIDKFSLLTLYWVLSRLHINFYTTTDYFCSTLEAMTQQIPSAL